MLVAVPGQVYIVNGVPAEAGMAAFVLTLNVFAISYPNAIANAVASSVVAIVPVTLGKVNVLFPE